MKLTVPRRDEVSGVCVTVDCLTPEQLGICSWVFISLSHILRCQWCRSLLPVHKHSFKYCACDWSRSLKAVCVFRFHVSSDEQAQRAGRQQPFDRWEMFLICYLCLSWVFFFSDCLPLFPTDSAWQYGSPGFQELKAEVTEVPAPDSSPDSTGWTVSPLQEQTNTVTFSKDNKFHLLGLRILRTSKKYVPAFKHLAELH